MLNAAFVLGAPRLISRDGPTPSLSFDPNTSQYCSWWLDVSVEYACSALLEDNYISLEEFRRWVSQAKIVRNYANCGLESVNHGVL
jgi:hypothetical protein